MSWEILNDQSGLNGNAQLWILTQPDSSAWSARLDWHLNGLISQAEHRRPQKMSATLLEVLKSEELEIPITVTANTQSLLIASEKLLPNQQTVFLTLEGSIEKWIKQGLEIANKLQSNSIRFFLSPQIKQEEITRVLEKLDAKNVSPQVSIVPALETLLETPND